MKTFLIITNNNKDPKHELTDAIAEYIDLCGARAMIADPSMKDNASIIPTEQKIDFALVLGGDGTMLRAAKDVCGLDIPLLGINLGTLGFLSDVEKEKYKEAIDRLLAGEYYISERMMAQGVIESVDGNQTILQPALNDITIIRNGPLRLLNIKAYVNDQFLYNVGADGIIAATPTGSTGYNLSAGGPIVHPSANLIVMTPVCAHSINGRSIVVGPDDTITFVIGKGADGNELSALAGSDGNEPILVKTDDKIIITVSKHKTKLIKLNQTSFIHTLNRKMSGLSL